MQCEDCSERLKLINETMNFLNERIEVPVDLTNKILANSKLNKIPAVHRIDFNKYIQIAALIVFGIFLGAFLGRNADSSMFLSKKEKKDKALMEYMEKHHLYDDNPLLMF